MILKEFLDKMEALLEEEKQERIKRREELTGNSTTKKEVTYPWDDLDVFESASFDLEVSNKVLQENCKERGKVKTPLQIRWEVWNNKWKDRKEKGAS